MRFRFGGGLLVNRNPIMEHPHGSATTSTSTLLATDLFGLTETVIARILP
jgi:hypothetical protein